MAVWMDGEEARVFHVDGKQFDEATIRSPKHHVHRHAKDQQTKSHGHPDDDHKFFREISDLLGGSAKILVLGPSVTKLHFLRYLQKHNATLESRIVGLETVGHPTDGQIVQHVRSYFDDSPHKG